MTLMVDREIRYIEAPLLEIRAGVQDRMMIDLIGDDVTAWRF